MSADSDLKGGGGGGGCFMACVREEIRDIVLSWREG